MDYLAGVRLRPQSPRPTLSPQQLVGCRLGTVFCSCRHFQSVIDQLVSWRSCGIYTHRWPQKDSGLWNRPQRRKKHTENKASFCFAQSKHLKLTKYFIPLLILKFGRIRPMPSKLLHLFWAVYTAESPVLWRFPPSVQGQANFWAHSWYDQKCLSFLWARPIRFSRKWSCTERPSLWIWKGTVAGDGHMGFIPTDTWTELICKDKQMEWSRHQREAKTTH